MLQTSNVKCRWWPWLAGIFHSDVEPKIGGILPHKMDGENNGSNPYEQIRMIWGVFPLFLETPIHTALKKQQQQKRPEHSISISSGIRNLHTCVAHPISTSEGFPRKNWVDFWFTLVKPFSHTRKSYSFHDVFWTSTIVTPNLKKSPRFGGNALLRRTKGPPPGNAAPPRRDSPKFPQRSAKDNSAGGLLTCHVNEEMLISNMDDIPQKISDKLYITCGKFQMVPGVLDYFGQPPWWFCCMTEYWSPLNHWRSLMSMDKQHRPYVLLISTDDNAGVEKKAKHDRTYLKKKAYTTLSSSSTWGRNLMFLPINQYNEATNSRIIMDHLCINSSFTV